ncbi:hypothetical protein MH117_05050 [Paenibacillus sp. ACRRX]|uniref:hypothetical protein n=1 Tax=Paenibacillus sp. ACRRX TaxID=2918206 RepID=UPI001EF69B32|nr:hypothetical protein [Paenibacillus sp. ACRRX]MCG7406778.1 hypothetical protein [Paenibacillus sp. ACRRX]
MRLRQRDLKPYAVRERIAMKEPDGTTYEGWDPTTITIKANKQPAGGKVMAEIYSERLSSMLTLYVEARSPVIEEIDVGINTGRAFGICVYPTPDSSPDYKVIAVRPWGAHKVIDLEKVKP